MTTTYPLAAVRSLALYTQGLTQSISAEPPPAAGAIYNLLERLGCLQVDTLQMVHRSHYAIAWSRLGCYEPAELDRLVYDPGARRAFEYWFHAACILPLSEYRYRLPQMRRMREQPVNWWGNWLAKPGMPELVQDVHERVRQEGPLRASDFAHDGRKREGWWDWKPAKLALELLYDQGELMISDRVNFQRVYELRERVLPEWVDTTEPTWPEMARHVLARSVKALGICLPAQAADYTHDLKRTTAKPFIEELLTEGILATVQGELADGRVGTLVVHRDNLLLMEQAADGALPARRTTFLNPFDPLFYPQGRDVQFWNFRQVLEAYKPEPTRQWGYFCLPILHRDRLVGRFDPKLERATGTLRLKALYLEPDVELEEDLVTAVATAMRDFLAFHEGTTLVIERSEPAIFAEKLLAAM